jgi:hypothetical protein
MTTTSGAGGAQVRTSYTVGLDVIAQQKGTLAGSTWTAQPLETLLYDGHGSTRALMQGAGASAGIASGQIFDYDAYGQMLPRYSSSSPTSEIGQVTGPLDLCIELAKDIP